MSRECLCTFSLYSRYNLVPAVVGTACNDGWIHYQTSCYLFKDNQENWASAGVGDYLNDTDEMSTDLFVIDMTTMIYLSLT